MVSIIVPVKNEIESLRYLLPDLCRNGRMVLVCDGGSTDGTQELVESYSREFGSLQLVPAPEVPGTVVDAILRGIWVSNGSDIIVVDGDGSHPPSLVDKIEKALASSDLVIGSRYMKGGSTKDTLLNRIYSMGLNTLTWGLAPRVKDRVSGVFGIRGHLTKTTIRNTVKPMLEFLVRADPKTVREVPYDFVLRSSGESSIGRGPKVVAKAFLDICFLYLRKYHRFVKFCLIGGIGTLIVLGITYILTEFAGLWYMASVVVAAFAAAVWNFTLNRLITFATPRSSDDEDYEWNAWYHGSPVQKIWKRWIGRVTKRFLGKPESVVELGCGSSPLLNYMPSTTKYGFDLSVGKIEFLERHSDATLLVSDLETGRFVDRLGSFSVEAVICNNVLEHLSSPDIVVEGISDILTRKGVAVITVPDSDHPLTSLVEWLYGKLMPGGYAEDHITKFSLDSLQSLCLRSGLQYVSHERVFTDVVVKFRKAVYAR